MKRTGKPNSIVVALDVGTTKICVLVAQRVHEDRLEIIGIGKAPSQGLARGVVVDIALAVQSIKAALKEAEFMSGMPIESVYVGISGSHVSATTSQGVVPLKKGEIRQHDIAEVIAAAKAIPLAEGQHILHVVPQMYTIDGHHRIRDPLGMFGVRLEAQVHIVIGDLASVNNLVRCCEMAGVKVRDIILEPLASAAAVLSKDEAELGVFMLDIGGGTSDFAFYQQGSIHHTKVFPLAGNLFTQDIALCLRTTLKDAERVKKEHGSASMAIVDPQEMIEIELVQGNDHRSIPRLDLAAVLESRAQELCMLVHEEIKRHHLSAPAGLVLTGGGALLEGLDKTATDILKIPVRLGRPVIEFGFKESLDSPMYATSYGLLVYALNKDKTVGFEDLAGPTVARVFSRMKSWILDFL